jgi:ketosteroid isomerase-like protein
MMRTDLLLSFVLAFAQALPTPQAVVDDLLAADRGFSASGRQKDAVAALSAMFADDVAIMVPASGFARGKAKAAEALAANPDNNSGRVEWTPIRAGISADGLHGFTVGYMTLTRSDATRVPIKYVAYWVKKPEGWRVAVYKRVRAGEGSPPRELMPPALPARIVPPSTDAAATARFKASLDRAERDFSDEAQQVGLGPAFAKHGSADAVNVGPPTGAAFVVGAEAIGRAIGGGSTESPVTWAPDEVIVASSGDLGVTFGTIRRKSPPPGQPPTVPYITVWRRASPADPWKYVAE